MFVIMHSNIFERKTIKENCTDVSADGQCALSISCTVSARTVATGCVFMYDSNGDGTLDSETN